MPSSIQDCVFGFTLSRLPSLFRRDLYKLFSTLSLPPGLFNITAAAFAGPEAPLIVYINKKIQDIIWIVLEARPMATKSLVNVFLRYIFLTFIELIIIWSAITFVSNVKIISLLLK